MAWLSANMLLHAAGRTPTLTPCAWWLCSRRRSGLLLLLLWQALSAAPPLPPASRPRSVTLLAHVSGGDGSEQTCSALRALPAGIMSPCCCWLLADSPAPLCLLQEARQQARTAEPRTSTAG